MLCAMISRAVCRSIVVHSLLSNVWLAVHFGVSTQRHRRVPGIPCPARVPPLQCAHHCGAGMRPREATLSTTRTVLDVTGLSVAFPSDHGSVEVVHALDLAVSA